WRRGTRPVHRALDRRGARRQDRARERAGPGLDVPDRTARVRRGNAPTRLRERDRYSRHDLTPDHAHNLQPMRPCFFLVALSSALACCSDGSRTAPVLAAEGEEKVLARIDFQDMQLGQPPRTFTSALTGGGAPGTWTVPADPSTP